jgi:PIN domain nuclease of toxin-antitoxin system
MALVLDTHAVIWYLSGSKQSSPTALAVIGAAERNADEIYVSAISLLESFIWPSEERFLQQR